MMVLLVLLLVMILPWVETNVTVSGRQNALRCHVCEKENSFDCVGATNCSVDIPYCAVAAVRIFPRFYYVSKQCAKYCGIIGPQSWMAKSFVLVKPTPFLYLACCSHDLCNTQKPVIKENTEEKYKEVRSAGEGSGAGLVTLAAGLLGLRLQTAGTCCVKLVFH
ncbi:lymphocyte antigen 6K [Hippopotamus amphibius kiboko]|uniref:lymphocyte antigen 6K n=1 Tax=Hippopotamus amphibius kiboko TaxID=575201 RepID=UPI00259531D2|nr:lymphocyte antigen 6K [Hippopotamus amphibius kiboko]